MTSRVPPDRVAGCVTERSAGPGLDAALLLLIMSGALHFAPAPDTAVRHFGQRVSAALTDLAPGSLLARMAPALHRDGRDPWVLAAGDSQILEITITGLRFVLAERAATPDHPGGCIDVFLDDAACAQFQFRYCSARGAIVTLAQSPRLQPAPGGSAQ